MPRVVGQDLCGLVHRHVDVLTVSATLYRHTSIVSCTRVSYTPRPALRQYQDVRRPLMRALRHSPCAACHVLAGTAKQPTLQPT